MRKNIISLVIIFIFALLFLDACGSNETQKTGDTPNQTKPTITPNNQTITKTPPAITSTSSITAQASPTVIKSPATLTPSNNSQSLEYRWLNGIPCRPPCWEGITPGKTSATEAIQLLKKNPLIASVFKFDPDPNEKLAVIGWNWTERPALTDTESAGGRIFYDYNNLNEPVVQIRPEYSQYSFKLKDIIQAYGEPDYVRAFLVFPAEGNKIEYDLEFIYVDLGFIASTWFYLPTPTIPNLTNDIFIERGLIFIEPGLQKLSELFGVPQNSTILVPWQGIKDFDFYCRQLSGSKCIYTR